MSVMILDSEDELRKKAIGLLVRELGPVDSARFINLLKPPKKGTDSVKIRRKWLASIDQEAFVAEALANLNKDPRISEGK